jgi:hypothetical protein
MAPVQAPADDAAEPPDPLVAATAPAVSETLEALAREGARRMLEQALHAEVDAHLGRSRYDRVGDFTGYRNGYGRDREVTIGTWSVEVHPPRVADTPAHIPPFRSSILPRGRALSTETQRLFARLYLEGLSSGDFEPAFRELVGERAPLSSSTILRLKEVWKAEYAAWRVRPITEGGHAHQPLSTADPRTGPRSLIWRRGPECRKEFLAAQPVLPPTRGRHATGRGYPMNWYEDAVADLLTRVSLGADVVAKVVEEIQRDAAPDPVQLAQVKRERAAAMQRLERDRDIGAWQATMRRLDATEAATNATLPEVIPAAQVVAYLRNLPETWNRATGGRGRRMLAEALLQGSERRGSARSSSS